MGVFSLKYIEKAKSDKTQTQSEKRKAFKTALYKIIPCEAIVHRPIANIGKTSKESTLI